MLVRPVDACDEHVTNSHKQQVNSFDSSRESIVTNPPHIRHFVLKMSGSTCKARLIELNPTVLSYSHLNYIEVTVPPTPSSPRHFARGAVSVGLGSTSLKSSKSP